MTEQARRKLDQRIYDVMGKKLYQARKELGMHGPEAAVYPLLDAMDDCYALLSTWVDDSQGEHTESDEEDTGHSNQPSQARFSDVHIKPKVYKVEDGHPWKESDWPALREVGNCALCGHPETMHLQ